MNRRQVTIWVIMMAMSAWALQHVHNGIFGLLDNGPMLLLMLMGLDPNGYMGKRLAKYQIDPVYLACAMAMLVNTVTDGVAGLGDPDASFFGVVLGCLAPIAFLPMIWQFRHPSISHTGS